MKRWLQALILLALGVLILVGLFKVVNPEQVANALRHASIGWLALGLIMYTVFVPLRGWRWKVILDASAPHIKLGDAVAVTAIGFGLNSVSAFKIGDVVRLATMAQRARIGVGEAGATVVLERVLDVLALVVIAIGAALFSGAGGQNGNLWKGAIVFSLLSVVLILSAYLLVSDSARTLRWFSKLTNLLPDRAGKFAYELGESILKGFSSLRSSRHLVTTALLSLLIWIAPVLGLCAFFRALSPQLTLPVLLLAMSLFTISQAVSITPGSVGTYEGFFFLLLSGLGAHPQAVVTAVAVLSHIGSIAVLLLSGAIGALWLRLQPATLPVGSNPLLPSQDTT
jgi:uncharacterized protein (TIRG00374 family)